MKGIRQLLFAVPAFALALVAVSASAAVTPGSPRPSPACDQARPAVLYHPRGPLLPAPSGNVPCRYDVGAVAMEPSFVFDGSGRILYQTWGASAGTVGGLPAIPGVVRSDAAHLHWQAVTPAGLAQQPNSLDPYIYRDPWTGRIFSVNFAADGLPLCAAISYSDDSGDSWTTSPAACGGFDGESIGAGPPVNSHPVGYPDIVYYCTGTTLGSSPPTTTPICSKSLDGGLTFNPTGAPPYPALGQQDTFAPWAGNPVVGTDGTIYLPKRFNGQPQVAISHDEGLTWTHVAVAGNGASGEATRVAVGTGGIYYTWTAGDHMPYLSISADGGGQWSAPMMLAPPGLREAALPRVAVSPTGAVAIVYLGSTNAPGHSPYYADCNVFLSQCSDGPYAGSTWNGYISEVREPGAADPLVETATVNSPSSPLFIGGCSADGACKGELDFLDVHFDSAGHPWGAFVDDCQLTRQFTPVFNTTAGPCEDGVGEGILGELAPALPDIGGPASRAGSAVLPNSSRGPRPIQSAALIALLAATAAAVASLRRWSC